MYFRLAAQAGTFQSRMQPPYSSIRLPASRKDRHLCVALLCLLILVGRIFADDVIRPRRNEPLVDVTQACPGVLIELRYATSQNITGAPIYRPNSRALLRRSVAERLRQAQEFLTARGFGLKVWDAYRPPFAQEELWADFVGDPAKGGSLHSWGVAVDVTLVDRKGKELRMPTGFDFFGPEAARRYTGGDLVIATNLRMLQQAMASAGFLAMRDEWWHFAAKDFREFGPVTPPVALFPTEP